MPLPIAHACVGAGVVAAVRPRGESARDLLLPMFVGAVLANCPDLDFAIARVTHDHGWHRGPTHSLLFAAVAGLVILASMGASRLRQAVGYGLALMSHGLLDFATTKVGGGVELLWPFTDERFRLGVVGVSEIVNGFRLAEMLKDSLIEALIFIPLLLAVLFLKGTFAHGRGLYESAR
jgi:inner membrane protein